MLVTTLVRTVLRYPLDAWRARRVDALLAAAMREAAAGDTQGALRTLARAALVAPRNAAVHAMAGRLHAQMHAFDAAKASFERLLAFAPDYADAHADLGSVCRLAGDYAAAETSYAIAAELAPGNAVARHGLALMLVRRGVPAAALPHLRAARLARPDDGEILKLLVQTLVQAGHLAEACETAQAAVRAPTPSYEAWTSLGLVYRRTHRSAEALECYDAAARVQALDVEAITNRGIVLQDLGRLEDAFEAYDAALVLDPDFALARFHRSLGRLLDGDYAAGWPDYETRLVSEDRVPRESVGPRWDGAPLRGRSILVHGEQGIGDEIMFASCLPDLMRDAGPCAIECAPKLSGLFARAFPDARVYAAGDGPGRAAAIEAVRPEVEVPIGSLPLHYRTALADFPRHRGYLHADAGRVAAWRAQLDALGAGLKVGISWRGGSAQSRVGLRSIGLERWGPLLTLSCVHFVSLQYTEGAAAEVKALDAAVAHWPAALADYEDTAALVSALDLTISVCTAVVHLAGALGAPVWVMAPQAPEWRYGNRGESMPWYPTARLFRQGQDAQWEPVIARVAAELAGLTAARSARSP